MTDIHSPSLSTFRRLVKNTYHFKVEEMLRKATPGVAVHSTWNRTLRGKRKRRKIFIHSPKTVDRTKCQNPWWILSFNVLFKVLYRWLCIPHKPQKTLLFSRCKSCQTLCNPMDCSTPGSSVLCHLPELAQTHMHWVSDAIQPSHPLLSPSRVLNLSQHQGPFQWVGSLHQVAKVFKLQL